MVSTVTITEKLVRSASSSNTVTVESSYWDSPEVKLLFCPKSLEHPQHCLMRFCDLMYHACINDDVLMEFIGKDGESSELFSSQK